MKKLLLALGLLFITGIGHALTGPFVQITTGTLQPNTTNGFYVSSGTAVNLNVSRVLRSTGTFSLVGATMSYTNAIDSGTLMDYSTRTFQGAVLNGTKIDNSTTTWTAAQTFSSGTFTNFNTSSVTANVPMSVHKLTGLAAGTTAGDSTRFEQMKLVQWSSGTLTGGITRTSTSFSVVGASCTITPTSASNWIVTLAEGVISNTTAGQITYGSIARDAVNIGGSGGFTYVSGGSANTSSPSNMLSIDRPGDTSSHIYAPMIRVTANSGDYCGSGVVCNTFCFELAP